VPAPRACGRDERAQKCSAYVESRHVADLTLHRGSARDANRNYSFEGCKESPRRITLFT